MLEAQITARFLKSLFADHNFRFDKYIIDTSPYLRCMMTAGPIAKEFDVKNITINYRLGEVMKFKKDAVERLEFIKHECSFGQMK